MSRLITLAACVLLLVACLFFWWRWAIAPVNPNASASQIFVVNRSEPLDSIGQKLKLQGLIRSPTAFKLMVVKLKLAKTIQAGDFRLNPAQDLSQIILALTQGSLDVWVTLPEGWRREQIAARLHQTWQDKGQDFAPDQFLRLTQDQEGYLFPDTYLIPQQASPAAIVKLLTQTFSQKTQSLWINNQTGLTQSQVVILAAIVEREARGEVDRQIVANILTKRLKSGMGLNADATLQYILGTPSEWWPIPSSADKKLSSPFNTYLHTGLPPAPIANPGLASLMAVIQAQDTPYLYYLHDSQGTLHPATTLEEHTANIHRYL